MSGSRTTWMAVLAGAALAAASGGCGPEEMKCPTGQTNCGGFCTDTSSDPSNCVLCGARCATGASCTATGCQCPTGQQPCGGACVILDADPNCGACGHTCGTLGTCSTATTPASCDCGAYAACPGASPECVDTATSGGHCGSCSHSCGLGTCGGGLCACDAGTGILDCGAAASPQCVNTLTDPSNCGGCGTHCMNPAPTCSAGLCCPIAQTNCFGTCHDLLNDPDNCGNCSNICPAGQRSCSVGHCCAANLTWCGGPACVNTQTDPANCGICGYPCSASQTCVGGVCQCQAPTPLACGANCCAGTQCCSGNTSCQALHSNGLGQSFYDCNPLGTPGDPATYNQTMAMGAAAAWAAGTDQGVTCGVSTCLCRITSGVIQRDAAVWCYAGAYAGYVGHASTATPNCFAVCPFTGGGTTTTWQ